MKILLDECTPRLLKRLLSGFEISTVQEIGWTGVTNGELLRQAEDQFDVFITTDKSRPFQKSLTGKQLANVPPPVNQVPVVALVGFRRDMRLILIIALLLSSCSKPEPNQVSAPTNNSVAATPERGVEAMLSEEANRVAALAGLRELGSSNLGSGDIEIRVWFGFGLFPLEGFVLGRSDSRWSAIHLKADQDYESKKVSRNKLHAPKSGWEACWQQLEDAGVLNLPDGTDPADPDAQGYVVQIRNAASYRSYHYVSPEYSELPAAKNMLRIGDIISNEFGLQRFKARKPV